jgi:ribosome-associated toxin RatA of RatAB toxin-antitoxin module
MPGVPHRLLLPVALLLFIFQTQAADVIVHAVRQGETFHIDASAEFEGDVEQTWQVLTDYDHLADFIPGIHASHVVTRDKSRVIIEQKGEAALLFFSFPIEVRLAVEEYPYRRIASRAVAGNVREMHNTYYLEVRQGRIRLLYTGRMTPDFPVPPVMGTMMLRRTAERQFSAMVDEIIRRRQRPDVRQPPAAGAGR